MTIPVSSPWQTLLASPGPDGHVVQLYQDDGFFGDAVSHFAASGLAQGDAVILVATGAHWELLADCLSGKGLDVVALRRHGQLLLLDADATLPTFLIDTLPDAPTFKALARATIAQARTGSQSGRVRWWGEMVNVLFVNGNGRGSTRLEELFDEVAHEESIAIFCSFLMDPLDAKMYEGPLQAVCGTHAYLIPVADDAHQTACVHQALLDVFGTVERPLLEDLRSATGWQGTGMPPAQALLLWLNGTVPHVAALVLARARHYAQIVPGGRPLWSRIRP
jgi:MEDS: MEthanogen/methylotroph, DcmR Sensory domain